MNNKNKLITNKDRHDYYKKIYPALHPNMDEETRTYTRPKPNFDYVYKNMNLIYSKDSTVDFSKTKTLFNTFNIEDEKRQKSTHEQISFYLFGSMVPGFSHKNFNEFKKENNYQSPDLKSSRSYEIDKWYFRKKDDRTDYYEKFFLEKEIDKLRKKNKIEAGGKEQEKPVAVVKPTKKKEKK